VRKCGSEAVKEVEEVLCHCEEAFRADAAIPMND